MNASKSSNELSKIRACLTLCCLPLLCGCATSWTTLCNTDDTPASAPLGTLSDQVWSRQEELGEAADFVIPIHEFKLHSYRLNSDGEDHVKRLANRLLDNGEAMPVVIERSTNGNTNGKYKYPVNVDPELDNQRRDIVVRALMHLGISNADDLVTVAPAFATPAFGQEAAAAFSRSFGTGFGGSGFGGGFGGFGGGGTFGGSSGSGFGGGVGGVSGDVSTDPVDSLSVDP